MSESSLVTASASAGRARERLVAIKRLGWVDAPSPVEALASRADELRLDALWVKRDDQLGAAAGFHGGTKIRKLDVVLAAPPWRDAPSWVSVGAIGSGNLVALTAAALKLDRRLRAHVFWEPPQPDHIENLAFVASGPTELVFSESRVSMALRHPRALLSKRIGHAAVVPPGTTCLEGEMGVALGAIELASQITAGLCPAPAHVFAPVGSMGTVAGLMVGLALAGIRCTVHGVAVVEHVFAPDAAVRAHAKRLLAALGADDVALPELRVHRDQLGRGYGIATKASLAECERSKRDDLGLEAVYSGKAMAGLRASAGALKGPVLFWLTPRRPGALPASPAWREKLPRALQRRLDAHDEGRAPSRRRFVLGSIGAVAAVGLIRTSGYPDRPRGVTTLGRSAAASLRAVIEVAIAPPLSRASIDDAIVRVDRYVATQPRFIRMQIDGAFTLIEQAPSLILGRWARFSELPRAERVRVLDALVGTPAAEAGRAVRDLAMLGHYQREESWSRLDYRGPWVGREARPDAYARYRSDGVPSGFEATT